MSMKNTRTQRVSLAGNQQGMVSILVTMILMIVLSLIVLGFAQISRRNQRETLDQQLSTQAFYAAESGVNDATQLINNALSSGATVYAKTSCAVPSDPAAAAFYSNLPTSTISSSNVSYSCLMVDPTPPSLDYGDVNTDPIVVPLSTTTGLDFSTLTLTWKTKTADTTPIGGCPTGMTKELPTSSAWTSSGCGYGVLRFDLVPTSGSGLTANSLSAATMTSFVVPLQSGGTPTVNFAAGGSNTADVIGGNCNNTSCSLTVSFATPASSQYFARISSLYRDVSLQVTGTDTSSKQVNFSGAQIAIDATGKAQDVLRRIEVRVSTSSQDTTTNGTQNVPTSQSELPYYALGSGTSICKEFATTGSATNSYFSNSAKPADGSGNQLCQ
ncbi:MAG TPA: PilX N-terminal domain-containing pilus assembly protein [Candidatus Saccharimonadales bacterium]